MHIAGFSHQCLKFMEELKFINCKWSSIKTLTVEDIFFLEFLEHRKKEWSTLKVIINCKMG